MFERTIALILTALAAACASTTHDSVAELDPERTPGAIAQRLADSAAMRADPNHMRVLVHFRRPADLDLEVVAPQLEREVVIALSGRMHLFDSGLAASSETWEADLDDLVDRLNVTHALICDTAMKHGEIELSMRLVEHSTLRIVATSQGTFPLEVLTDGNRVALTTRQEAAPLIVPPPPPIESRLAAAVDADVLEVAAAEPPPLSRHRAYENDANVSTLPLKYVSPQTSVPGPATAMATGAFGTRPPVEPSADELVPPPMQWQQDPQAKPKVILHGPASRRLQSTGREIERK